MELNFRRLLSLLLVLPSLATTVSANDHPAQSPHANNDEVICHGLTCYPRVFIPTHEFQVIHEDQQVPPGLHVRLNLQTGVREAKINVPDEGLDKEAATIHLPSEGGTGEMVFVPGPEEDSDPKAGTTGPTVKFPEDSDLYGAVKPPPTAHTEQLPFTDSVDIVISPTSHTTPQLHQALMSLENLVHEIYWGLKLSTPSTISALLRLIKTSSEPSIRSSAALVIGSALSNNPKALHSALSGSPSSSALDLIPTLLTTLQSEPDNAARARIMYALNQSIKSPQTLSSFHHSHGISILKSLFATPHRDGGEFKAKCSTFIEDNFLNEDFRSDTEKNTGGRGDDKSNKLYLPKAAQLALRLEESSTENIIKSFCPLFQDALLSSDSLGITDDDHKTKILSALIALRRKVGNEECVASEAFLKWFGEVTAKGGKSVEQLEDEGEWFRLMAMENEASFGGKKKAGWF